MIFPRFAVILLAAILAMPSIARAQNSNVTPDYLAVSMGWYDVNMQKNESAAFELLYRFGRPFFWKVKPFLGVMANSDSALYAYGGLGLDLQLSDSWYFYPNVGVGAYAQGDSKDLGYGIEFHDSLELGYQFENNARLGLSFTHMSNASLGDKNPGTEILSVVYAIPFGR